mmetsp:Transcript_18521/g.16405  ORF Transcript_18521/g.16405 Transcript_18521/m.16405 type:complete len:129 (-) Transcript_18521:439-825(-)
MYSLVNANKSNSVLEVAVGAGAASAMFTTNLMKEGATYIAGDISDQMLNKINTKLDKISSNDTSINYELLDLKKNDRFEIDVSDPKQKKVCASWTDNENLPFADNQFETYIANYSLHIVDNPTAMLEE